MIEVTVNRAVPEPPPVETITLTLDYETAMAVRAMCGLGTVHMSGTRLPSRPDGKLVNYNKIQPTLHSVWHAIDRALGIRS